MGRIYLERKDYPHAIRELRIAEVIKASAWDVHKALGDALLGSGDIQGAITELKQSEALAPQNYELMSKLAPLLEKTGDKDGALQQYRLAAEIGDTDDARKEYAAAQVRLKGSISVAKNKPLQPAPVSSTADTSDPESAWRNSMDASTRAMNGSLLADAEKNALTAVSLAEKFPKDSRLVQSVSLLGWVYIREKKYSDGRATWMRALSLNQELYGPESQETIGALEGVAGCAYQLKDYSTAEDFYSRAIELEEKTLGPSDMRMVSDLYWLGFSYQKAGSYAKAEPIFLKLLQMNSAGGHSGLFMQGDLLIVAKLYLDWGKLDQAESYARKSLNQREQDYGSDSPMIVESLQTLADVLKRMGKSEEAAQIQTRHDSIKATSGSGFGRP
jgi:tetratricopeptide (TPR) repeat protein